MSIGYGIRSGRSIPHANAGPIRLQMHGAVKWGHSNHRSTRTSTSQTLFRPNPSCAFAGARRGRSTHQQTRRMHCRHTRSQRSGRASLPSRYSLTKPITVSMLGHIERVENSFVAQRGRRSAIRLSSWSRAPAQSAVGWRIGKTWTLRASFKTLSGGYGSR
jgi:hypothetical protein